MIVLGGDDGTLRSWELATGATRGEPFLGHKGLVSSIALGTLKGRPVIVSGGVDGAVRVWDLVTRELRGEPLSGGRARLRSIALEGRTVVVSGGDDGAVRVCDLVTGATRGDLLRGHRGLVSSIALGTIEGRPVIVSGGYDSTVQVWDLATGELRGEPRYRHRSQIHKSQGIQRFSSRLSGTVSNLGVTTRNRQNRSKLDGENTIGDDEDNLSGHGGGDYPDRRRHWRAHAAISQAYTGSSGLLGQQPNQPNQLCLRLPKRFANFQCTGGVRNESCRQSAHG